VSNSPGRFDGLDSRESPAGTALSLILDWVDNTFVTPVEGIWVVDLAALLQVGLFLLSAVANTKEGFVFGWGKVSKLVKA